MRVCVFAHVYVQVCVCVRLCLLNELEKVNQTLILKYIIHNVHGIHYNNTVQ